MTSRGRAAGPRSRRFRDPSGGADAVVAPIPRIVSLLRSWASEPFDYLFVIEHHSMRPLHVPYRILVIVATAGMAICSMFLLLGSSGPTGTFGRVWPLAVLVVQVGYIALVAFGPTPTEARTARLVFIGSAVFCDLGLGSVLIQYSPIVSVVACSLLALPSALCVVCVSARWLFAHLVFCVAIISWCAFRVYRAAEFDGWTLVAGVLTTLMAVCLMPAASHLAWNLLSADARSSLRDPLTGLANRRGLRSALRPLWDAALASDDCVGVICIDIDDFKHVNDHLGHDAGDAVLRETADALTLALQPGAVAGRTGGEEFTIVLTGSAADVETMAVDLPAVVSRAGRTTAVTVSVGAVVLHPRAGDDLASRLRTALLAADALMYEVKRNGGDATLMRRL